jgi:hypothetical protein
VNLSLGENQVVDEIQAAKILGRAVQTLRNDRHLRQGPAYIKLGRSVRYQVKDLIDYLQRNKIDPEKVS